MTVAMQAVYTGKLGCDIVHAPSGDRIATDAPKDNAGEGRHFSPTDLLAASLGACVLTTMGIVAQRHNILMQGATADIEKHMEAQPRRHVGQIVVRVNLPAAIAVADRPRLEQAAHGCPVHASLGPSTDVVLQFAYTL